MRARWLCTKKTTPALTSTRRIKIGFRDSSMYAVGSSSTRHPRAPTARPTNFSAMSKKHSELLQMYADRIWKVAQHVWRSCSSSMLSRAFIHAYRIMEKIIEHDEHNHWLVDGTPHCNIHRDYIDTKHGIAPKPLIDIDM